MYSEQKKHIDEIRNESKASQRIKDNLKNSIQALAEDLYSKETHFIFELIQNAEDNEYEQEVPSLIFELIRVDPTGTPNSNGALVIHNNEIGFSKDNVDAICSIGKTTKSKVQGYIGEKGIGFKSVFRVTSTPHIFSNGYHFSLPENDKETGLGYIVPRWIDELPQDIDLKQTTIILPLDKRDFGYDKVRKMLEDIEPETILFLSKLKELQIRFDTGEQLIILKDDSKAPLIQVLVERNGQGESFSDVFEFFVYTKQFDKPKKVKHEKRRGIKQREVSIAFPLTKDYKCAGKLFAYLPVRSDTGLPFLINADFILTSSREDIQKDVPWNQWLMDCAGKLLLDALLQLKDKEQLDYVKLLESLADSLMDITKDNIFYPVARVFYESMKFNELLPASDETFVSAEHAKLAGSEDLRKLLTPQHLNTLFGHDYIKWLSSDITEKRTPKLWKYFTTKLEVEEIDAEKFARRLTKDFLEKQDDEWFIQFYKLLLKSEYIWPILRRKPIIRLEGGSLVEPINPEGHVTAYLPPEQPSKFPVVSRTIVKDKDALEFLKRLGLEEPDEVANVIENILPKYVRIRTEPIDAKEYESDLTAIFHALESDSQNKKERLLNKLSKAAFIKAKNAVTGNIEYKRPDEVYLYTESLQIYFEGNCEVWFVAQEPAILNSITTQLRIPDRVRVHFRKPDYFGYVTISDRHGRHERGLDGFDPDTKVDGLEFAVTNPTAERAKVIWNEILIPYKQLWKGIVETSTRQSYNKAERSMEISRAGKLLLNNRWIPNKAGGFYTPADISLEDLPDDFIRDENLAENLGLKRPLAENKLLKKVAEIERISPDLLAELLNAAKREPEKIRRFIATIAIGGKSSNNFPQKKVGDMERRGKKIKEQVKEAPRKKYEKKEGSDRISIDPNKRDIDAYLRSLYTNDDGIMICQICKKEMPFKKRNGEYYFERVEAFDIPVEHEANYLALCPICSAMYTEFIKNVPEKWNELKKLFVEEVQGCEVSLSLGNIDTSIRFVEVHCFDLRIVLEEMVQR